AELHRHARQVRHAQGHHQGLQDDRQRRVRHAARASVLHGGADRGSLRESENIAVMAAPTIHVDVVSAEESIYSGEAEFVVLPGEAGELGIYPRHTPLITRIKPGAVRITPAGGGEEQLIFVAGGILEVQPTVITVLADTAVRGADLDEAKANHALKEAEEARKTAKSAEGIAAAEASLAMLAAQIAAIRKLRKK